MSHFIEAVNGLKFLNWDLESTKSSEIAVLKKPLTRRFMQDIAILIQLAFTAVKKHWARLSVIAV